MKTTRSYLVRWATLVMIAGVSVSLFLFAEPAGERGVAVATVALGEAVAVPVPAVESVAALMESAVEDAIQLDRQSLALDAPGYARPRGAGSADDVDVDVDVAWLEDVIAEVAQSAERSRRRPCGAGLRI